MDIGETDAKLQEIFRHNAPKSNERHLAAALSLGRTAKPSIRAQRHWRGTGILRAAAITVGVLVLAGAAGGGIWTIVSHVGQGDSIIVITDQTISPADGQTSSTAETRDLLETVTDGSWELRVDRWGRLDNVRLPSEWLPETAYVQMEDPATFRVLISEGGTRISIEGDWGGLPHAVEGERSSADSERIWYDFDVPAGGRFVIWRNADGLQAEETLYGSGRPMIRSLRGSLARIGESGTDAGEDALFPIRVDSKWGFIDNTGTIKIEPQFEGVRRLDGEGGLIGFSEGLCAVQTEKDGPWGYINASGHLAIEPQFDLAQWFCEGVAAVRNADDWFFIDKTGAKVLGPFDGASCFSGGLASVVDSEGRTGLIDENGDWVPEVEGPGGLRLSLERGFFEGLAVACPVREAEGDPAQLEGYVGESGALVIEPKFNRASQFSEGLAAVGVGENDDVMTYGYIDKTGSWVIQPQFWSANPFSEGLARVAVKTKEGVKVGFIDKTGAWVIQPRFADAHSFSEGLAIVWWDDQCGYIDKTGTVVIPLDNQIAGFDFSGSVACVGGGFDSSPSYIDKTGKTIWEGE